MERKCGAAGAAEAIISMEATGVKQAREQSVNPVAPAPAERHMPSAPTPEPPAEKKAVGYGLPCSRCLAYYPADMHACPICKATQRVSPDAVVHYTAAPVPPSDNAAPRDEERERLLKELKSQAFASHTQINTATAFQCVLKHQHTGANEPAAVCHNCYSEASQKADRLEAALHMDVKDAAKIVYAAVWADTTDPNATYLNAAKALLGELQNRAGIGLLLGPNQSLAH
jgi:hypothetical protein